MKKLLVVSSVSYFREIVAKILEMEFEKVLVCDHKDALEVFLSENPSHVIIFDYIEPKKTRLAFETWPTFEAWQDIKAASQDQIIIRCGLDEYDHSDYLKMPFRFEDLKKILLDKKSN